MNATNALDVSWSQAEGQQERPEPRTFSFQFRGAGAEYFRIWIVNLLLTILTLGVFSAWAKVRRIRYFYGNTYLDGQAFAYHARPQAILVGRLIVFAGYAASFIALQFYPLALLGLIPLVALGLPWILMRSRRFQLRMTSWRNLRFRFDGRYGEAINAYLGWYLLAGLGVFLLAMVKPSPVLMVIVFLGIAAVYPLWVYKRVDYSLDNSGFGRESTCFLTGPARFFGICLATAAVAVLAFAGFMYALYLAGMLEPEILPRNRQLLDVLLDAGPKGWLALLAAGVIGMAIASMYRAWFLNAAFGGVALGRHQLRSTVRVLPFVWIRVTNLLAIVATLGLYYPFAKVRQLRYLLSCFKVEGNGRFEQIEAAERMHTHAFGEEAGDFFNVDVGL